MKNRLIPMVSLLVVSLAPSAILAAKPDQCALNSTCSFSIRGKFNKELITTHLRAGRVYICRVLHGDGSLLSLRNVYASPGVSYRLKGERLDRPLIIHGPETGHGYIRYTLYNNDDPWNSNEIQWMCRPKF